MGKSEAAGNTNTCPLAYIRAMEEDRAARRQDLAKKIMQSNKENDARGSRSNFPPFWSARSETSARASEDPKWNSTKSAQLRQAAASERMDGLQRNAVLRSPAKVSPKRGWTIDDRGRHVPIMDWEEKRASKPLMRESCSASGKASKPVKSARKRRDGVSKATDAVGSTVPTTGSPTPLQTSEDADMPWTLQEVSCIVNPTDGSPVQLPLQFSSQELSPILDPAFEERFEALQTSHEIELCEDTLTPNARSRPAMGKSCSSTEHQRVQGKCRKDREDIATSPENRHRGMDSHSPIQPADVTCFQDGSPALPCAETSPLPTTEQGLYFSSPAVPRVISHSFVQLRQGTVSGSKSSPLVFHSRSSRSITPATLPRANCQGKAAESQGYSPGQTAPGSGSDAAVRTYLEQVELSSTMPSLLSLNALGKDPDSSPLCAMNLSGEFRNGTTNHSPTGLQFDSPSRSPAFHAGCGEPALDQSERELRSWLQKVERLDLTTPEPRSREATNSSRSVAREGGAGTHDSFCTAHEALRESHGQGLAGKDCDLQAAFAPLMVLLERRQQLDHQFNSCLRQLLGRADVRQRLKVGSGHAALHALEDLGKRGSVVGDLEGEAALVRSCLLPARQPMH